LLKNPFKRWPRSSAAESRVEIKASIAAWTAAPTKVARKVEFFAQTEKPPGDLIN
jgi:hypothetical protein